MSRNRKQAQELFTQLFGSSLATDEGLVINDQDGCVLIDWDAAVSSSMAGTQAMTREWSTAPLLEW